MRQLRVRRPDDAADNLWNTLNRVQEVLTKGGVRGVNSRRQVRGVRGINESTRLNKALWTLTRKMAELAGK